MVLLYRVAADLLVLLHLVFILFVVAGGFAVFKWPWMAFLHIPAAIWGALIEYRSWVCPLTPLENRLRQLAGDDGYSEGFIEHYIMPLVYPPGLTRDLQTTLGTIVVVINLLVYGVLVYRMVKN
jgi:hypothetical protein